jgi:UDP:flavonoid glycosyltransferase YjiC (YdhE family)
MKILFASMPFDGHFNPLTGLAVHLQQKGHDVRWYTGPSYATKLGNLGIPHFPFREAREVNADNLVQVFPEYEKLGGGPKGIEFATAKIFFGNTAAHFRDIHDFHPQFPFDALVCDGAFYAAYLVAEKLQPMVYPIGPAQTPTATSKTAPPPFFGLKPAKSIFHKLQHRVVRMMVEGATKTGKKVFNDLLAVEGLPPYVGSIFDLPFRRAKAFFQIGVPGFDYPRSDWPKNFQFVGPLLPHKKPRANGFGYDEKRAKYSSMVVVSQGTVDNRDPEKLFVPALEALKGGPRLVVATTGYKNTAALRQRFPEDNVIVEDFIDFDLLLEDADLFICNGGYGSVLHALVKGVPVLSAGKLEGKGDINARIDYCGLGLDLKTERPTPKQIATGVERVLGDKSYAKNVARVQEELASYRPFEIIERRLIEDHTAMRSDPETRAS